MQYHWNILNELSPVHAVDKQADGKSFWHIKRTGWDEHILMQDENVTETYKTLSDKWQKHSKLHRTSDSNIQSWRQTLTEMYKVIANVID